MIYHNQIIKDKVMIKLLGCRMLEGLEQKARPNWAR